MKFSVMWNGIRRFGMSHPDESPLKQNSRVKIIPSLRGMTFVCG